MPNKPPLVSVTITSYNYANYIGKTIESILKQTFTDFEIVIVDDASADDSVEVIKKFAAQDSRIRLLVHEENKGYGQTLKDVTSAARGTYMLHMDSDDWIRSSTAFERQVAILEENPDVVFVYSTLAEFNNRGEKLMTMRSFSEDKIVPGVIAVQKALEFYIGHSGPMFRSEAFRQCGGYALKYRYVLDIQLWVDLCSMGKVGYIHDNLYAYRQHKKSMTAVLNQRQLMEEMLNAIDSVFEGPLSAQITEPTTLKRRAYSQALTAFPMTLVFENYYQQCWKILWVNLKLRPRETLFNKRIAIISARTMLGAEGYKKVSHFIASKR